MKKIIGIVIISMLIATAVVMGADWDNHATVWLEPSDTTLDIGSTFTVTIYVDSEGTTCSQWNIVQMTYNETYLQMTNCTDFTFQGVWDGAFDDATVNNDTGIITNCGSFIASGYPSDNRSACVLDFNTMQVGILYINITSLPDVREPDNDKFTVTWNNLTLTIYPYRPMMTQVDTIDTDTMKIRWNPDFMGDGSADKVRIVYETDGSYPSASDPNDGTLAYNGTGSYYSASQQYWDHDSLDEGTTYRYRLWSWNETTGLYSQEGTTDMGTTHELPGIYSEYVSYNSTFGFGVYTAVNESDTDQRLNFSTDPTMATGNMTVWDNTTALSGGVWVQTIQAQQEHGVNSNTTYYCQVTYFNGTTSSYYRVGSIMQAQTENDEPNLNNELPSDTSTDVNITEPSNPANPGKLLIVITDTEGDPFNWSITTSPNVGSNSGSNGANGSYNVSVTLEYATLYTWNVNVMDTWSNEWTNESYTFTTEDPPNQRPDYGTPSPTNGSTNRPLALTWSILISDAEGDDIDWSIECENGQSNSDAGVGNGTRSLSISGLSYGTEYTIWVNASDDGSGLTTREWFVFTTLSNSVPQVTHPTPDNETTDVEIDVGELSVAVEDPNGDSMDVDFYWGNDTLIGSHNGESNGTVTQTISDLSYGTTYYWYAEADDGTDTTTGGNYSFTTENCSTCTLTIDKTCNMTYLSQNFTLANYTIIVTHTGNGNLTNILVNDTFNDDLNYTTSSIDVGNVTEGSNWVSFMIGDLASGENNTFYVTFNLTDSCTNGTYIYNNISATSNEGATDTDICSTLYGTTVQLRVYYQCSDAEPLSILQYVPILFAVLLFIVLIGLLFVDALESNSLLAVFIIAIVGLVVIQVAFVVTEDAGTGLGAVRSQVFDVTDPTLNQSANLTESPCALPTVVRVQHNMGLWITISSSYYSVNVTTVDVDREVLYV